MLTNFANLYLNFSRQRRRYENMGLSMQDVLFLANDVNVATFFDSVVDDGGDVKLVANWIMGDIAAYLKNERLAINEIKLTPKELTELIASIQNGSISGKIGKEILVELISKGEALSSQLLKRRISFSMQTLTSILGLLGGDGLDPQTTSTISWRQDQVTRLFCWPNMYQNSFDCLFCIIVPRFDAHSLSLDSYSGNEGIERKGKSNASKQDPRREVKRG